MRLVVHGQQAFGKAVLEALLKHPQDQVIAVFCGPEKEGQKADPLKEAALAAKLPVHQPKSYKKPDVWEQFASLKADLCVMAYVTLFVPEEVLSAPKFGTIQYHPSLLPRHRGPSSINWPLIWGEKKTGLTIFWPDNGLDTGPVLLQKEVPVKDDDTLGSLYFDKLFPMGVEAMLEAVELVRAGKAPKIKQDESQATYEGWCKAEQVEINWDKPVAEVYNLIRGANPQPGAWTKFGGKTVQVFESAKQAGGASGKPGLVLDITDKGMAVATQGGQVLVQRVRPEGGPKVTAAEFAKNAGLKPGSMLGA